MYERFKEIIIFARPWDLDCFLEISNRLCNEFNIKKIKIITAWKEVSTNQRIINNHKISVYNIIDLTKKDQGKGNITSINHFENYLATKNLSLNVLFSSERFIPKKKISHFFISNFTILNSLIGEKSILLSNQPDHYIYWLAAELTLYKNGTFFGFSLVGRPSMWTQILKNGNQLYNLPTTEKNKEIAQQEYLKIINSEKIGYMTTAKKFNLRDALKKRIVYIFEKIHGNYFLDNYNFWGRLHTFINKYKYKKICRQVKHSKLENLINEKIIYLALHFEPEASTSVYSPLFNNQSFWIESVIKAIPQEYTLVIKENPKMHGKRPITFYKKHNKYPNLKWIHPKTDSIKIIKQCDVLLTITGTAAIEALAFQKKVILFGRPPYMSFFKDLNICENISELPTILSSTIYNTPFPSNKQFIIDYNKYISNLIPDSFVSKDSNGSRKMKYYDSYYERIKKILIKDEKHFN